MQPYWRRRWLVLAILVLVPGLVYGLSKLAAKTFEAHTTLLVRNTNFSSQAFTNQISITAGTAEAAGVLIRTVPVAAEAARELGEPASTGSALLGAITVTPVTPTSSVDSQFLTIAAQAEEPERAADVANAFATAIIKTRTKDAQEEINRTIGLLEQRADELDKESALAREDLITQIQQLEGLVAAQKGTTQVIESALAPGSPISPRPLRNTALGLVLALLIAAGAVPLADRINRKLRAADELEDLTGSQLLAQIPESAFPGHPPSPTARESFQTLRAALRYFNLGHSLGTVLITSAAHEEGKTTVATNLALALARDGEKVILVDADLRRPRAASFLGAQGTDGLEAVLIDGVALDDVLEDVHDGETSFSILGSARPAANPAMLLSSGRMKELLAELAGRAEIVIIDTPPLLVVSDAIPLMAAVSGVVLVSRVNQSNIAAIRRTCEVIDAAQGKLLGVVATATKAGGLYRGYGDYGYAAEEAPPNGTVRPNGKAEAADEPVAGWYADPAAPPGHVRYWNGHEWTEDRSAGAGD